MTNNQIQPGEKGYLQQVAYQATVDLQKSRDFVAAQAIKADLPVPTVKVKQDTDLGYRIINEEDLTSVDELYRD